MAALEKIGGASDAAALTTIFVKLGRQLLDELNDAKGDEKRLAELRGSFEGFLANISGRTEGQSFGSLIWIAETYSAFGQGATDSEQAGRYHKKASEAYQKIFARAKKDDTFLGTTQLLGVKVRFVRSKRREGDFQAALNTVASILAEKPRALNVQFEAALILQDWGADDQTQASQRFLKAINGTTIKKPKAVIWGWAKTALTLQRTLRTDAQNANFKQKLLQSRYNLADCRHQMALAEKDKTKRNRELQKACLEIAAFRAVHKLDGDWPRKFESLYQQMQKDMQQP